MIINTKTLGAWVLHKYWSGDSSARVSFFTREYGLIQCLCKRGRTPKKQALLQAFTPLWISITERYDRFYAQSIESTAPILTLTDSALFAALYVNEILYYILKPNYSDPLLYDAYIHTLQKLTKVADRIELESTLRRFEWTLLKSCGYSFSCTEEACTAALIEPNLFYHFVAGEGFILASQGILGASILALAGDDLSELRTLNVAKKVMRQALDQLLGGREIKTRSLFLAQTLAKT